MPRSVIRHTSTSLWNSGWSLLSLVSLSLVPLSLTHTSLSLSRSPVSHYEVLQVMSLRVVKAHFKVTIITCEFTG
jgi:hypothetical protein